MTLAPGVRRGLRRLIGQDEFAPVLVLLAAAYILSALSVGPVTRGVVSVLYVVALAAAMVASRPGRDTLVVMAWCVGATWLATGVAALTMSDEVTFRLLHTALAGCLLASLGLVMHRVLANSEVGLQALCGAIAAYLLIGLLFASLFAVMAGPDSSTFFASREVADSQSLQYFSFTTLATLGYGDLTAAGNPGRAMASMEAIIGQVFLATLVARLVSKYDLHRRRQRRD